MKRDTSLGAETPHPCQDMLRREGWEKGGHCGNDVLVKRRGGRRQGSPANLVSESDLEGPCDVGYMALGSNGRRDKEEEEATEAAV